jgi:hypothetical protein
MNYVYIKLKEGTWNRIMDTFDEGSEGEQADLTGELHKIFSEATYAPDLEVEE